MSVFHGKQQNQEKVPKEKRKRKSRNFSGKGLYKTIKTGRIVQAVSDGRSLLKQIRILRRDLRTSLELQKQKII